MIRPRIAALAVVGAFVSWVIGWWMGRRDVPTVGEATIRDPEEHTVTDERGAVRSTQAADVLLPASAVEEIWSPRHLERLARTYWRYLTRVTLGLVRVRYAEDERRIVLLTDPFTLLTFHPPDYRMDAGRGIVRWRIKRGLLVDQQGHDGDGYLQIDVERCPPDAEHPHREKLHVEVEVANFYPAIASRISRWAYENTQSRIHVVVTHGFLRSLARLDLAESHVGRFARIDEVPDPPAEGPTLRGRAERAAA